MSDATTSDLLPLTWFLFLSCRGGLPHPQWNLIGANLHLHNYTLNIKYDLLGYEFVA